MCISVWSMRSGKSGKKLLCSIESSMPFSRSRRKSSKRCFPWRFPRIFTLCISLVRKSGRKDRKFLIRKDMRFSARRKNCWKREGNSSRKVQTISIQSRCCITGTAFMKMCFPSFSSFLRKRRKSKTPHFPKRRFPKCCPSTGCSPILISGLESTGRRCSMPPQCCNRTRSRWMSYRLCSLPFPGRVRPGEK